MVSVRISREVLEDIKKEAQAKFMLSDPKPTNKVELNDQILDAIVKIPYYKLVQDFFNNPEVRVFEAGPASTIKDALLRFQSTGIVKTINITGLKNIQGNSFTFSTTLAVPRTMHFTSPYGHSIDINVDVIPEPLCQELKDAIAASLSEVQAWEVRHKEYTDKTNEIFDACRTTAQLLTAWPAAEAFLPKTVVDKMQTKVVNQADLDAKAKREAFNSEGLDQHILIANIVTQTGGNNGDPV